MEQHFSVGWTVIGHSKHEPKLETMVEPIQRSAARRRLQASKLHCYANDLGYLKRMKCEGFREQIQVNGANHQSYQQEAKQGALASGGRLELSC
jgi:hypothetical protein